MRICLSRSPIESSLSDCMTASWRRSISASGRARSSSIVSWWVRSKDRTLFSLSDSWLILRTTFAGAPCALYPCTQVLACSPMRILSKSSAPKLFTRVRRRRILGSSDAGSCIDRPLRSVRMASEASHVMRNTPTCCGVGWICRIMDSSNTVIVSVMVEKQGNKAAGEKQGRKPWTLREFGGKTFWDWLQLLIVPVVLSLITVVFAWQQDIRQDQIENKRAKAERELAKERAQDEALQAYLDQMSNLLLEKNLRTSEEDSEVRTLARARTLTVLGRLDPARKTEVMQFLVEAKLIQSVKGREPIIRLVGADLRGTNAPGEGTFRGEYLGILTLTNLSGAHLAAANLNDANLSNANLSDSKLLGA